MAQLKEHPSILVVYLLACGIGVGSIINACIPEEVYTSNNPGNIRVGNDWNGERNEGCRSKEFECFYTSQFGIRAMGLVLHTYFTQHGLTTVTDIIHRYAPVSDNNPTEAYVNFVSERLGVSPTQELPERIYLARLIQAMIVFEQGEWPYTGQEGIVDTALEDVYALISNSEV